MNIYNLVIVDDDEALLEGLCEGIDWMQMNTRVVKTAIDGVEAFEVLQNYPCDILLTDIRMGRMDGLKLTEKVHERFENIYIIMMSAYEDFSYAQKAMRLGVREYLLKPIDVAQLREAMHRATKCLEARRSQEQQMRGMHHQLEELKKYTVEEFSKTSSAMNMQSVERIAESISHGNLSELERNLQLFRENLSQVGGGSVLFFNSGIGLLLGQIENKCNLDDREREKISTLRTEALLQGSTPHFFEALESCLHSIAGFRISKNGDTEDAIARARGIIEERYRCSALRVRDIAAEVGLSSNYFSTMFARYVGESYSDYVLRLRMEEAKRLLLNTNLRTYEIASRVGYDNQAYFSTAFKRFSGFSVSQYRRKFGKSNESENNKSLSD